MAPVELPSTRPSVGPPTLPEERPSVSRLPARKRKAPESKATDDAGGNEEEEEDETIDDEMIDLNQLLSKRMKRPKKTLLERVCNR